MAENVNEKKAAREPLFHVVKRSNISMWKKLLIRLGGVLAGLIVSGIVVMALTDRSLFKLYQYLFEGNFGTERRIWNMLQETALLLGIGLALLPAFKMKFWNLGADGQVLIGALVTAGLMYKLGPNINSVVVNILMVVCSVVAGMIWALIPAIFKAKWKTNESLFTLMMNYIASGLTVFMINKWATSGSGTMGIIKTGWFPTVINEFLLTIIVVAVMTVCMFVYLKYNKHGYELTVVGESENTARYVGINVKRVVLRTMMASGALCGLMGCLMAGSINHTISSSLVDSRGFTAVLVTWLADFNPLYMILTALLIAFLKMGSSNVVTQFSLNNSSISSIITGIVIFCVIACESLIRYQVKLSSRVKKWRRANKYKEEEQHLQEILLSTNEEATTDDAAEEQATDDTSTKEDE